MVAPTDPDRAATLATEAERVARITAPDRQARLLAAVARVVAPSDPARAEQIARTITIPAQQAEVLGTVATQLAGGRIEIVGFG